MAAKLPPYTYSTYRTFMENGPTALSEGGEGGWEDEIRTVLQVKLLSEAENVESEEE